MNVPDVTAVLDVLRSRGHRMTPQRRAIVSEVLRSRGHISPQAIAASVERNHPGVNASTVYRTLELLEEIGVISHAHLGAGAEYHLSSEHDHVHMHCRGCDGWSTVTVEELRDAHDSIRLVTGFDADFTHFAISGWCARCASERDGRRIESEG